MTAEWGDADTTHRPRGLFRPRFASFFPLHPQLKEGAGKTGSPLAPAVPVRDWHRRRDARRHTGAAGTSRPSLRSGLTAYVVLSSGSDALLPPSPCSLVRHEGPVGPHASPQRLGASNRTPGPHDFAVRRSHRSLCARVPLTAQPPCRTNDRADETRVHRHPARVRDDRDTPLFLGPE